MKKKKVKILFFANIPIESQERSIGGATVLANNILNFIRKNDDLVVYHKQIRNFWKYKLQLIDYFIWLFRFPFVIWNKHVVSFHGTKDYHFTIAPFLWFWAKLFRKKITYHFFGGNFHDQYKSLPKPFKFIIKNTILKSDTIFFETLQLIEFFKNEKIENLVWLPNSRKKIIATLDTKQFKHKFVFISRIIPEKGINEIIKASKNLSNDYVIDIYGPIDDRHYSSDYFNDKDVNYKGILNPNEVIETLKKYDVLLLPSYFSGEGYPGIIIESLALGIPVITTNWRALPEIITDNDNGIIIDIKNALELEKAIQSINEKNYNTFRENAFNSFKKFSNDVVFNKIVESYTQLK